MIQVNKHKTKRIWTGCICCKCFFISTVCWCWLWLEC